MPPSAVLTDRTARVLLAIAAIGALGSIWSAGEAVGNAGDDLKVTAVHDLFAFPVYAALFLLLAWRPRGLPGVWELLILQKAAVSIVLFAAYRSADNAIFTATIDALLALMLLVAYVAARGWLAWGNGGRRRSQPTVS